MEQIALSVLFVCYDDDMKSVFVIFLFLFSAANFSHAYELYETEVEKPYDLVPFPGSIEVGKVFLGSLTDFPIMYEASVVSTSTLTVGLRQLYKENDTPTPFGVIVVKLEERGGGVTEIARFNPQEENWDKVKDKSLGLTFLDTEKVRQELTPGEYRVEVSTPTNSGRFMLYLGVDTESQGYFKKLTQARKVQKFMGYSIFKMVSSSLVYYPMGIIILLALVGVTRKYRKLISNVD